MTPNEHETEVSERQAHAEATYERLFGPRDNSAPDSDPELMEILRRFIFGTCSTPVCSTTRPAN
jgi:4-carboxymuconolactone decarboxylase